jgi:hypothetical protein
MTSANEPDFFEQGFGRRLHVAPGLGCEQHHLQQLVVAQGVGPGAMKALAQPLGSAD